MLRGLKRLIGEIHRRSLWQVLGIYLVASWAVLQVVDTLGGALNLPDWFPSFALALLLVGLPIVMATAFVQEGGPGREPPPSPAEPRAPAALPPGLFTWRNAIGGGVLAFALWGVVAAAWVVLGGAGIAGPSEGAPASIAVLPLEDLSPDPADRYIADGIHDEIIAQLSKIRSLQVISRASVLEYRESTKNSRTIAEELSVGALLQGSVRRAGDQIRIIVELVDPETDANVWVETYARELTPANLFEVQEGVARRVVQSLAATLSPEEEDRLAQRPTDELEAYDLYLRGRDYVTRSDREDALRIAEQMFEDAVEIDPAFALAFAELSKVHSSMFWFYFDRSDERASRAREAAERALSLAPDLPEAHNALGLYYYWVRLDYDRALESLAVATRQRPGDGPLVQTLGFIQRRQGRWQEAAENLTRAARLSPRSSPDALQAGITYLYTGEYDRALELFERASSLAPELIRPYVWQARVHMSATGDTARVRSLLERAERADPGQADNQAWWHWALYRVLDRPAPRTLERLDELRVPPEFYHAAKAELLGRRGQAELMRAHYDSARVVLEQAVAGAPDEARFHSELGVALAGLGRADEAVRAGLRAVELMPVSGEALFGHDWLANLGRIYVMAGRFDDAVATLEEMLAVPNPISAHWLRLDPVYAPMSGYPPFEELVARTSGSASAQSASASAR